MKVHGVVFALILRLHFILANYATIIPPGAYSNGARIDNLSPDVVSLVNNIYQMKIIEDTSDWGLWIETEGSSWALDKLLPSRFRLKLSGSTQSATNEADNDMLISFADKSGSKYFTMTIGLDGSGSSQIAPGCNSGSALLTGDVYSGMYEYSRGNRQCRAGWNQIENDCPYDTMGPAADPNSWPLSFIVETYPSESITIVGFEANGYTQTSCIFTDTLTLK